ncbi:MAG: hypothetical protein GY865_10105 [candidate division Zixibacteria bacterium]|nr:hypothetical protein [candidate division Zixibacteria bacterium]
MRKIFVITLLAFVLISVSVSAQLTDGAEIGKMKKDYLGLKPAGQPFSLIDLSKLKWTHSYSISFFSGGGSSGSNGLYMGNIFYEFSSKFSMNLRLGIAHDPSSIFDRSKGHNASFLPGIYLDYHPSPNFKISAGFETFRQNPYYYDRYRNDRRINSGQ